MFGLLDKTPRVARLLFERAQEAERLYVGPPLVELTKLLNANFAEDRRWASPDQVTFRYDDLRDFSFAVIFMLDKPVLTILAGGPFKGFMLQHASNRWQVSVESPMGTPLGPKAKKLGDTLEREYGVRILRTHAARPSGR